MKNYVKNEKRVEIIGDPPYVIWYIPEFPLCELKLSPLEDDGFNVRREMLAADIAERGLINPLIVWNHTPALANPSPRPYYLHFGYNKLWALKHNGATHARAFLTLDVGRAPAFPCRGMYRGEDYARFFGEGKLIVGQNGPLFKEVAQLDNWQVPE